MSILDREAEAAKTKIHAQKLLDAGRSAIMVEGIEFDLKLYPDATSTSAEGEDGVDHHLLLWDDDKRVLGCYARGQWRRYVYYRLDTRTTEDSNAQKSTKAGG